MALDFQQVRDQVRHLGENAKQREGELKKKREQARTLLANYSSDLQKLQQKVQNTVQQYDPSLRCALPVNDALDSAFPTPALPKAATILAADGSQINPDRHAEVDYCLINVGAIQVRYGTADAPRTTTTCRLFYDQELYTATGTITEARLALLRDSNERKTLSDLAEGLPAPVITFTDGPMELWGGPSGSDREAASEFQRSLEAYKKVLAHLNELQVTTAGYVDKPGANLVVRLLEVTMTPEDKLNGIRENFPLRGVTDYYLYCGLLSPGERSAVFAMQSQSAQHYPGPLALHFFYLNVGKAGHSHVARVEIPAWVVEDPVRLDELQAVLVHQCRMMGTRPYPYLLHRAHETAVVTLAEKDQVTQMIALELRRRGMAVGEVSYKQSAKGLGGRTRL